ncbi:MAG: sugar phosphate isomerase/epimerase [Armatimonadetes bacterium]|nr:sugar phosphate isomerase/epimerase [Armatimonadota bacterium]
MKLCIESGNFGQMPRREAFESIRKAGFTYVELNPDLCRAYVATRQDIEEINMLLDDNGLVVASVLNLIKLGTPDEAERCESVEQWKRAISFARSIGAEKLTAEMTGDKSTPEASADAFKRSMDEIMPIIEDADLSLSYECHPGDFIETSNEAVDLIREIGHPRLGYLYCIPHSFVMGDNPVAMVRYAGETISHVHIADTLRKERIIAPPEVLAHCHMVPGMGEVDFVSILTALRDVGYDDYLSVVLFSHFDDPFTAALVSKEKCEELLAEVGYCLESIESLGRSSIHAGLKMGSRQPLNDVPSPGTAL